MTILDIVSRDAFKESPLESEPGWPGGRWEPALNQSTKTNKRGWSLGGVARAGAMGGLVVGGAAAAVLASNAQSRQELTDRLRAAINKFLDNGDAAALTGIAQIQNSLRDALRTLNAQGEMIAEISTRLDNVQVQMNEAKGEVAAAREVRARTIAELQSRAAEHKKAAERLQIATDGVNERSSKLLEAAVLQMNRVDNDNEESTKILNETTGRSREVAETQRKIESLVIEFTSVYAAQEEAASQLLAKLESATTRLQADLQRHEQGSQANETEESASKDRLQQIEARLTDLSHRLAAIVIDTAKSTAEVIETTKALTAERPRAETNGRDRQQRPKTPRDPLSAGASSAPNMRPQTSARGAVLEKQNTQAVTRGKQKPASKLQHFGRRPYV